MKTNKDIEQKVKSALDAFSEIEEVTISPFFKDKTMNRLFLEKETSNLSTSWLSPKLQFAMLIGVIVLNVFAYVQLSTDTYNDSLVEFAEDFGLSEEQSALVLLNETN